MALLAAFALLLVHITGPGERIRQDAAQSLAIGESLERPLQGGDRHLFRFDLAAGELATITVEQRGIDAVIEVLKADGTRLVQFQHNLRTTGSERGMVVADATGPQVLAVIPSRSVAPRGTYSIRFERRAATAADRSLRDSFAASFEVALLMTRQKADEALPIARRALALAEQGGPSADLAIADASKQLGEVYAEKRTYKDAAAAFLRSVTIYERIFGPDDPFTAYVAVRLGAMYQRTSQPLVAERTVKTALRTLDDALGPDHLSIARALTGLASIRQDAGDIDEAEALYRRSLAIVEKEEGPDTLKAVVLNNLGTLALNRRNLDEADQLLQRAATIGEKVYGRDSYWMANAMLNLGIAARQRKAYGQAETYYLRALAIREKLVPADHPDIASNLNNLATLYSSLGDPVRSLETHRRALAIWEKAGGPYGSGTLMSLGNIARVYAAEGDMPNAVAFQRRADAALEVQLALNLAVGSERQRLASAASIAERTDRTISLSLGPAAGDPDASALAALVLLQRKGRVLDAMTETIASFRQRAGTADADLLEQLGESTGQLARLALNGRQGMTADQHRAAIAALEQKKERIESAISEHNAEFRARAFPVTLETIQAAIPGDATLVEYAVFRPFNPKAPTNAEAYGAPHYAAYVIAREGTPRGFDLGDAAGIDEAVDRLRAALRDPRRRDVTALARAVDVRVLAPLRQAAGTASRLLISPDGALNLIPFEALVDERGRYAIERYAISYLTSGRDLLRMAVARPSRGAPVIVADPAFGAPSSETSAGRAATGSPSAGAATGTAAPLYFAPLAGTAQEARAIRALFPEATILSRDAASKVRIGAVPAPAILHIASHGFFLQDARIGNPLLRSGLALAGANTGAAPGGGGILTALEAANLDLWGTRLVTLSACDTGLGTVRNGEGVYGLRRAFVIAGTETLVMSLWPVSDYVTRQMMSAYYSGLRKGLGRGQSLREAQLALLSRPNRRHPFYWASFIQAGDWSPLKGS